MSNSISRFAVESKRFGKQRAKGINQVGVAVEIHRVFSVAARFAIDANRAAAFRLRGEIGGFIPFQRFFNIADSGRGSRSVEDKLTRRIQSLA